MTNIVIPKISIAMIERATGFAEKSWYRFLERLANKASFQDTGWTAATGASAKGAYAVYGGTIISNPPTQAQVQAVDAAVVAASKRIVALEAALRNGGLIDG